MIARWPEESLARIRSALLALGARPPVPAEPEGMAALQEQRLADPDGRLTDLGHKLAYHLGTGMAIGDKGPVISGFASMGPEARVLDIGCGAGQTLRLLDPYGPSERVGVDVDLDSLAFGARLADMEGGEIAFVNATAYARLFRDGWPLTFGRSPSTACTVPPWALAEMARVLQPGGVLILRIERVWFDLWRIRRARGLRTCLCLLRDLGFGVIHDLVGWQPVPGSRLGGGRAFGSTGRMVKILCLCGCEIFHVEANRACGAFLGAANQITILAERRV